MDYICFIAQCKDADKGQKRPKKINSKQGHIDSGLKVDKVYAQLSFLEIEIDTYLLIFFGK